MDFGPVDQLKDGGLAVIAAPSDPREEIKEKNKKTHHNNPPPTRSRLFLNEAV